MNGDLIMSTAKMSFHLDGENEIDASLLSHMISDMAEYTKIVANEVNPDALLKMNVTAFKNGSFQIDFSAVCEVVETLLTNAGTVLTVAATVIGSVKGGIEIKKLLKGEKAKKVSGRDDTIEVETQSGEKITVPKASQVVIYNVKADQLVSNIAGYVREHNPDGGFSVSDSNGEIYCSSEEIKYMERPAPIEEITACQRVRVEADLLIRKAVLEGNSKWGFDFEGKAIEASIIDDDFLEWFQGYGIVKRGDYINAIVEIYVDIDPNGFPIKGTEKYTIAKVNGKIQHDIQQEKL